jgi:diaminopimelate epimerase
MGEKIMEFIKMQGTGNDYIFFDNTDNSFDYDPSELSIRLSDRNFGIGGDGIVLISEDEHGMFWMKMWNSDGSEGKMCGNAIRCVAKYLYDNHFVDGKDFIINTISGPRKIQVRTSDEKVSFVCVNMGSPLWETQKNLKVKIDSLEFSLNCLSVGNPHCVIFTREIFSRNKVEYFGKKIQEMDIFGDGINVEFVKILDKDTLNVQVYERGSGYTLSCGTGACAAAAVSFKLYKSSDPLKVLLPGGELNIKQDKDGDLLMEGECVEVFRGEIKI